MNQYGTVLTGTERNGQVHTGMDRYGPEQLRGWETGNQACTALVFTSVLFVDVASANGALADRANWTDGRLASTADGAVPMEVDAR